jgi:hypothetical protein
MSCRSAPFSRGREAKLCRSMFGWTWLAENGLDDPLENVPNPAPWLTGSGSILVPTQADGRRRWLRLLMAVASDSRGLRRVAYFRGAPGVAYESVALPLSYPGVW